MAPPLTRAGKRKADDAASVAGASGARKVARTEDTGAPAAATGTTEGAPSDEPGSGDEKGKGKKVSKRAKAKAKKAAPRAPVVLEGDWSVSAPPAVFKGGDC